MLLYQYTKTETKKHIHRKEFLSRQLQLKWQWLESYDIHAAMQLSPVIIYGK
jgi:hypothetical protein